MSKFSFFRTHPEFDLVKLNKLALAKISLLKISLAKIALVKIACKCSSPNFTSEINWTECYSITAENMKIFKGYVENCFPGIRKVYCIPPSFIWKWISAWSHCEFFSLKTQDGILGGNFGLIIKLFFKQSFLNFTPQKRWSPCTYIQEPWRQRLGSYLKAIPFPRIFVYFYLKPNLPCSHVFT